jgi:HEAT repeat protein
MTMRKTLALLFTVIVTVPVAEAQFGDLQDRAMKQWVRTLEKSDDPAERREAVRNLGNLKTPEAVRVITDVLTGDEDATVRRQAADTLWRISDHAAAAEPALRAALEDPSPGVRVRSASALESLGVPAEELVDARIVGLEAERLRDRILASRELIGFVEGSRLAPPVIEVAAEEAETLKWNLGDTYLSPIDVLERMVKKSDPSFVAPVLAAIRDVAPGAGHLALGLETLEPKPEDWTAALVGLLDSPRQGDRTASLTLLRERTTDADGVATWVEPVTGLLADPNLVGDATFALRRAGGHAVSAVPALLRIATGDTDPTHREQAIEAIEAIGARGQAFPADTLRGVAESALGPLSQAALNDPEADVRGAAVRALQELRLEPEEVIPIYLEMIENESDESAHRGACFGIRDLGTDAATAIPRLEQLLEGQVLNRDFVEQALNSVRTSAPDRDVATASQPAGSGDADAALAALRAAGIDFSTRELYVALQKRQVDLVRHFLDAGMNPDQRVHESTGMRPLHTLYFGQGCPFMQPTPPETAEITRLLIERGADVNLQDDRGNSVLKMAAGCEPEVINALIAAGADPNAPDPSGMVPFDLAISLNKPGAAALIDAGFRLSPERADGLRESYAQDPEALALIDRAAGQ